MFFHEKLLVGHSEMCCFFSIWDVIFKTPDLAVWVLVMHTAAQWSLAWAVCSLSLPLQLSEQGAWWPGL